MMHGDIDNCSLHHMQQNLISHVKAGVSGFSRRVMKSVLIKLCFINFSFFFFRQPLEYQVPLNLLICLASM